MICTNAKSGIERRDETCAKSTRRGRSISRPRVIVHEPLQRSGTPTLKSTNTPCPWSVRVARCRSDAEQASINGKENKRPDVNAADAADLPVLRVPAPVTSRVGVTFEVHIRTRRRSGRIPLSFLPPPSTLTHAHQPCPWVCSRFHNEQLVLFKSLGS